MDKVEYADIVKEPAVVTGKILFEVDVQAEIAIDVFERTGETAWDFQNKARMALMDEAKRKVAMGNCQAKIIGLDIKLI